MTTVMMMWFKMSTVKTMTLMNVCCIVCVRVCASWPAPRSVLQHFNSSGSRCCLTNC